MGVKELGVHHNESGFHCEDVTDGLRGITPAPCCVELEGSPRLLGGVTDKSSQQVALTPLWRGRGSLSGFSILSAKSMPRTSEACKFICAERPSHKAPLTLGPPSYSASLLEVTPKGFCLDFTDFTLILKMEQSGLGQLCGMFFTWWKKKPYLELST